MGKEMQFVHQVQYLDRPVRPEAFQTKRRIIELLLKEFIVSPERSEK